MNTHLVCIQGLTFSIENLVSRPQEIKTNFNLTFSPSHALVKMVAYKAETSVAQEGDPAISDIVISENDAKSGLLFVHCNALHDGPIAILTSPSLVLTPEITIPLLGRNPSGNVSFSVRDIYGQLSDVQGELAMVIEFHR